MLNLVFAAILVGLPAVFGSHSIVKNFGRRNASYGFSALVYAVALCAFFAYWLPEGNLLSADWSLKMPSALAFGLIVGVISGLVQRRRTDP